MGKSIVGKRVVLHYLNKWLMALSQSSDIKAIAAEVKKMALNQMVAWARAHRNSSPRISRKNSARKLQRLRSSKKLALRKVSRTSITAAPVWNRVKEPSWNRKKAAAKTVTRY